MEPLGIVEVEVPGKGLSGLSHGLIALHVDLFVLDRSPEPLDEDIIKGPAPAVHADGNAESLKQPRKLKARKLATLIRVEDIGTSKAKGSLKRPYAELPVQRRRDLPTEHVSAAPVHYGHKVYKALPEPYIRDVSAPYLVRSVYYDVPQEIRILLVVLRGLARPWLRIYSAKPHKPHKASYSLGVNPVSLTPQPRRHLRNPVEGGPGVLLVQKPHEDFVETVRRPWLIIIGRSGKPQKLALAVNGHLPMAWLNEGLLLLNREVEIFF